MLGALALVTALAACSSEAAGSQIADEGGVSKLVISEPAHNLGYLPLYVAIEEGIFAAHDLDVSVTTQSTGGGAHVNAVLAGEAWGFIGGPEHNGFVKAKEGGANTEIKAIANVVNKGNVYLVARTGVDAPQLTSIEEAAAFLKGKSVVTSAYGGTPNSILRYILAEGGLTTDDITLTESADAAAPIAIVQQGKADLALIADPIVAQGVDEGIWQEPSLSVPALLGDYAYSTINVPVESYTEHPEVAQAFTDAMAEALAVVHDDRATAEKVAVAEFDNLDPALITKVLDRAYDDGLWPDSVEISPEATDLGLAVARGAGALDDAADPATYDDVVDMQFAGGN